MSLFPRAFYGADNTTSFHPLFRLLDDFDNYSKTATPQGTPRGHVRTFQPKFDVREVAEGYELHGELPGIEQANVEIEFTDPQTLTIRGRSERSYTSGTPPTGNLEDTKMSGTITDGTETPKSSHKATVEDEDAPTPGTTPATSTTGEIAKSEPQQPQTQEPRAKYWVSERSVGEFARSFSFPSRVDQDAVTASMKDGIVSIMVPKAKKHESRKITIS